MRFATKAARARGFIRLGIGLPRQDSGETGDGSWQERFRGPMPAKKAQMGAEQALGTLFDMAPRRRAFFDALASQGQVLRLPGAGKGAIGYGVAKGTLSSKAAGRNHSPGTGKPRSYCFRRRCFLETPMLLYKVKYTI